MSPRFSYSSSFGGFSGNLFKARPQVNRPHNMFLENEEEQQQGAESYKRCCHHQVPCRAKTRLKGRNADGQDAHIVSIGDDERPEEIIPLLNECDNCQCTQNGPAQRENNACEYLESSGTFNARGILQVGWNGTEELAHQEDPIGRAENERNNQPG